MTLRILHYSDLEHAFDDPERIGRLAGLLEARRDESTLLAGSGDNTSPGVLALVEDGAQALDFFEAVAPDVETFGNHEFDHGTARLRELVADSPQTWVSANVRRDGAPVGAEEGVVPWTVTEAGGETVAFLGVTTPATPDITPEAASLTFREPEAAVRDHRLELRDRADRVVVLAHTADCEALAAVPGVDAVLGGHTHEREVKRVDGTPVVRPGVNGSHVAELRFDGEVTATLRPVADAAVRETVAEPLRERVAASGLDAVVAEAERPVARTEAATFCAESRLGNFVTDAYRWASGADVALCSAGEHRTGDPLEGEVRAMDLVAVAPFDQRLVVGELPGDRLREAFEQLRVRERYPEAPPEYVGHVSGARLRWRGGDLSCAEVAGESLSSDRTYTVAASEHLFETDRFLAAVRDDDIVRTCGDRYAALVDCARETGLAPEIEGRIRRE